MSEQVDVFYTKGFSVSWEELHRAAKTLARRLSVMAHFEGVVAVTRGGLTPAAIVARELEIRVIDTIGVVSYQDNAVEKFEERERGDVEILKPPTATRDGEGWLIVDDLVDTGETAKMVRALLPKAHFATIYAKPAGRPFVDTFVTEVDQDVWVYFPWDLEQRPVEPIRTAALKA